MCIQSNDHCWSMLAQLIHWDFISYCSKYSENILAQLPYGNAVTNDEKTESVARNAKLIRIKIKYLTLSWSFSASFKHSSNLRFSVSSRFFLKDIKSLYSLSSCSGPKLNKFKPGAFLLSALFCVFFNHWGFIRGFSETVDRSALLLHLSHIGHSVRTASTLKWRCQL